MEVLQIGPANIAFNPIVAPIATGAVLPFSLAPIATCKITSMLKKVNTASNPRLWESDPEGRVAPRFSRVGNSHRRSPLATKAPVPANTAAKLSRKAPPPKSWPTPTH
jgi:hypothetical protein